MGNVSIGNEQLRVEVSPMGSEMASLVTSDGNNWLWEGDPAFWSGRSPVLFPMVGKSPGDHIRIDGVRYPMGQHGFARRSMFELAAKGEDFCRFELHSSPASRSIYPFDFLLAIEHRVSGNSVAVTAEVTNLDETAMPYGIGFHPGFVWPLPSCEGQEHSVTLDNGGAPGLVRLSGGLVKPGALPSPFQQGRLVLDHALFDADAMLFPEGAGSGVRYAAGAKSLHFTWENLPNFAIWSKPGAPFVCLEPWHGTAAMVDGSEDLASRPYGVVLPPGETARYGFAVSIEG